VSRSASLEAAHSGRAARWTATDVATRARDFVVAAILLLMLAPLLLIVSLAVAVSSPGPILFRQSRVGRGRQEFVMLKFRTMALGSDDSSHRELIRSMFVIGAHTSAGQEPGDRVWKLVDDERVTTAGRVLRRLSLDELPQLLNVLAGQMSLVGPRPALPWEVELFGARHLARFDVKPGMTGLWQVSGRSTLTMPQALDLDVQYVERRSFWLDLGILVRTIPVVFTGRGAS
jgi:lipopolysaccharide/colanic/teichoic acid biosynthesis glycosyltransferase